MKKICRLVSFLIVLAFLSGCAAQRPLETRFHPCHRVRIETPPIWTASAAWTPENQILLVGPERRSLLVYNLEGELVREVKLDALAEFEYASPVRLEATGDGYLLGDKHTLLWLDRSFLKRRVWRPFEHLKEAGIAGGSLSDFAVVGRTVYAFTDFLWDDEEAPPPKKVPVAESDPYLHEVPGTEKAPRGNWFRGFAKIDLEHPEVVTIHHFELEDDESQRYYFYSQRPYLADLDRRAYVLRYTDPPQVLRAARQASSPFWETLYSGSPGDDFKTTSLYAFAGRLYLLGWRRIDEEGAVLTGDVLTGDALTAAEPTAPRLIQGTPSRAQLLALGKNPEHRTQRLLVEIDPKTGSALRKYLLPVENGSVKLVPGKSFWAMIEESSSVNIRPEDKVHLTLLPAAWLHSPNTAKGISEVDLDCPSG